MNIFQEIENGKEFLQKFVSQNIVAEFKLIGTASYLPGLANDVDFAVMMQADQNAMQFGASLTAQDFQFCGDYDTSKGEWFAIRKDNLNLMLTHSREFYDGYLLATEVCKLLNIQTKQDRIDVCKVVRDKMPADVVRPPLPKAMINFWDVVNKI